MALAVVDSSGWMEFFLAGSGGRNFIPAISDAANLIVPTIAIFEVSRLLLRMRGSDVTTTAIGYMSLGRVEPLDAQLAGEAALVAFEHKLPMADSIIYATAQRFDATLWTQDADFEGLPGVRYFPKTSPS
jgi:predicted nucleic acid-binding protein